MTLLTTTVAVRVLRVCLLLSFFVLVPFTGSAFGQAGSVFVRDALVQEPSSGTVDMVFTVTLAAPATGNGSVNFETSNGTASAGTCGSAGADYVSTNGTVSFATGEQVKTINVPICSDAVNDNNETLIVSLTGPNNISIVDNQATGTITGLQVGTVLISELRHFGPGSSNDANDEFVEIYNNTDAAHTVAASDASAGYGLYKMGADCNATPIMVGVIPNGTVIPARGHYLMTGTAYSLANYGGTGAAAGNLTLSDPLPSNANIGIFSTSDVAQISSANRLDAVGFGLNIGGACNLLRESTTVTELAANTGLGQFSYLRKLCDFAGVGCAASGVSKDTNINADDFIFVDPNKTAAGPTVRLGAAGPENISTPRRNDTIAVLLLDTTKSNAADPNRFRDTSASAVNPTTAALGTLSARRRVINNTGAPVTRLRFRTIDLSGTADLRLISSVDISVAGVGDANTCFASNGSATTPCTVTVKGLTLEEPPAQPNGGGLNSTLSVTLGTPLAPGSSVNVDFKLGVMAGGTYRYLIVVEALP